MDEKLDTRRAIVVVETILSHFSERRFLITDYYEHWKVHVVAGKEFKSQWQQFIQNARKVLATLLYLYNSSFGSIFILTIHHTSSYSRLCFYLRF